MKIGNYKFEGNKYSIRNPLDILNDIITKNGGYYFLNTLLEYTDNWLCVQIYGTYFMHENYIKFRIDPEYVSVLIDEYGEGAITISTIANNVVLEPNENNVSLLDNMPNLESYIFFKDEDFAFKTLFKQDIDALSFGEAIEFFNVFEINTYKKLEQLAEKAIKSYQTLNNIEDNPFEVDVDTIDEEFFSIIDLFLSPNMDMALEEKFDEFFREDGE